MNLTGCRPYEDLESDGDARNTATNMFRTLAGWWSMVLVVNELDTQ